MSEQYVCKLDSLEDGEITRFELESGARIALYRIGVLVFATDEQCTHGNASLADMGSLEGYVVECGMHLGSFDVRTGQVVSPPCTKPLRTYAVRIEGSEVWVATQPA